MGSISMSLVVIVCLQWDFGIINAKPGKTYHNELEHLIVILKQ